MTVVWLLCKYFELQKVYSEIKNQRKPTRGEASSCFASVTTVALAFVYLPPTLQVVGGKSGLSLLYSRHYDSQINPRHIRIIRELFKNTEVETYPDLQIQSLANP